MTTRRRALGTGALLALSLTACTPNPPSSSGPSSEPTPENDPTPAASASPSIGSATDGYRDGRYKATGWYGSAPSHHDVTLTITNDTITDVEITTPAENETSLGYQQRFAEALPRAVIGRPIDELNVDRLAGSSGSSQGFMDALNKIRTQASI
jgi:uncharacterized protein with FMN-binding domain